MNRDQLIEKIKDLGLKYQIEQRPLGQDEYIRVVAPDGRGYCRISIEDENTFYIRQDGICSDVDCFDLITILEHMSPLKNASPKYVVIAGEEEVADGVGRGEIVGEFDTDEGLEAFLKTTERKNLTVLGPKDFKYVSVS